ncbi:hypothetical protein NEUTE1DRAFT_85648 [Neurospora tetrasperma FGSC 2508]|uniref:Uncharacterized protein n=1 Tax=Neurospora tetrasperma (strain FGSC 2508 / ATCC MYA-4615 / P0657) TaxID=510951 RepID=F8MTQ4_NEUT8|nr:uncharacterized protein NEUTE1DRAFT_85648 [Neurospora tetrasperma FGSC 2508]EGO55386.1 hypothetical protein NEUTE1DRAFT_85648 [Neurospora tetrasperma FGSC 2508]
MDAGHSAPRSPATNSSVAANIGMVDQDWKPYLFVAQRPATQRKEAEKWIPAEAVSRPLHGKKQGTGRSMEATFP